MLPEKTFQLSVCCRRLKKKVTNTDGFVSFFGFFKLSLQVFQKFSFYFQIENKINFEK